MDLDREKVLKLVIVALATLAALAVMSTLVQLIQTILPFLIVGAGIYAGYRWALSDAPAPTADEVEEQARGIFSRFRGAKQAVETSMKVGDALETAAKPAESQSRRRRRRASKPAPSAAKAAHRAKRDHRPRSAMPKPNQPGAPAKAKRLAQSSSRTMMWSSTPTTSCSRISRAWKRKKKRRPKSPTVSWNRSKRAAAASKAGISPRCHCPRHKTPPP